MRLYTTKEATALLKVSRMTLYNLIKAGVLNPRKRRNRERGGRGWNFFTEEDIKTVKEQTNCSEEQAKEALEKTNGNIAEAILSLKQ